MGRGPRAGVRQALGQGVELEAAVEELQLVLGLLDNTAEPAAAQEARG